MNAEQFSSALGKINDKYIMEAITYKKEKRSGWLKWGAMAACFGLILTAALVTLPGILKGMGGVVPPPAPDPGPVISSEEEPYWQTIEEICGAENQDGFAVMALYVPTYVAYQGVFYREVGASWVDRTGQTGVTFFNSDSTMLDTGTLEQIRFAATTENVICNPKAWLIPNYKYTIYLVENHMDCIALLINGYFTIYQKQFDITFELDGVTYGIVYEVVYSDHCTLGETLLSNENFTVYEAIFYLDDPNEQHTVYVVDLLPKLRTDGYISFSDDEVDAWWVAEPIEPLVQENPLPDKGSVPAEYPDTTIIPGFDLDEPSEPDSP